MLAYYHSIMDLRNKIQIIKTTCILLYVVQGSLPATLSSALRLTACRAKSTRKQG